MRSVSSPPIVLVALGVCFYLSIVSFVASAQPTNCSVGQVFCSGSRACVNLASDPRNCGTCGNVCTTREACAGGNCVATGPDPVYSCKFTSGKLSGSTLPPTGIQLSGPVNAPCTDNYGSSGIQVTGVFACKFTQGPMAGMTVVPTGVTLSGPEGQPCTDNYGNSGEQVVGLQ